MTITLAIALGGLLLAPAAAGREGGSMKQIEHLGQFPVIEFRRYEVHAQQRTEFARYFESYFAGAFQQLGALILGHFYERRDPSRFIWMRGFHDLSARAQVNEAFYNGPLWHEHKARMNDRLIDHTNVLLLQPLQASRGVTVMPAVDEVQEGQGARGVVVAQIFTLEPGAVEPFAQSAEPVFAEYREAGAREAGVLVTLDVANNFPRLPFRTDGPYLVWLGVLRDDHALETRFEPLVRRSLAAFQATGLLRTAPELIVLDPASRSRLRWLPEWP